MLRWCQSTVRALDGGGSSTLSSIRFRSSSTMRGPTRVGLEDERIRAAPRRRTVDRPLLTVTQPSVRGDSKSCQPLVVLGRQSDGEGRTAGAVHAPVPANSISVSSDTPSEHGDPLVKLQHILTPSTPPITPVSTRTLKKLYTLAKSRAQLSRLTSKQFTQLLSLMGTLSLPAPRAPCIYFSKLVSHIDESSSRTHWPFVLEVVRDKEELGWKLDGTDQYWMMRAQLAKVVVAEGEILRSGDSRLHALSKATEQYLRIRRHSPDPEIHLPYLQILFSLGSSKYITTLVRHLCSIFELIPNPHSRFIDLFCHILLKQGHGLSPETKEDIILMVSARVAKFGGVSMPSQKRGPPSANKVFNDVSKRYKRIPLVVMDLRSALGMAVFPFSSPKEAPADVQRWAHDQATQAFSPRLSQETRWDNLMLFAISRMPDIPAAGFLSANKDGPDVGGIGWRTVFVLATLQDILATMNPTSLVEARVGIQNIARPLWRMWKAENEGSVDVAASVIVASFYHVTANTMDVPLKEGCFRYCKIQGLFDARDAATSSEKLQTQSLFIAHILATISCNGGNWPEIFSTLAPILSSTKARDEIVEALLWHYIPRNVEDMLGLYMFSRRNNVALSADVIHALGISLASSHTLELAVPFLYHPQFTRAQVEDLLGAILRVFQAERCRRIDPPLADRLGQVMWKLYAHEPPAKQFKYPIRFFFSILIASEHPAKAVSLVEAIYHQVPSLFTTRLFLRIIHTLVRHRELHLATRVLHLMPFTSVRASDNVRRKLTHMLDRAGSSSLAKTVYRTGIRRKGWRTPRETIGRLVSFRSQAPTQHQSLPLVPAAALDLSNGPAIKYAVSVLVRARRSLAARQLFAKSHHLLDAATKISIGNIILHGSLLHLKLRNGRLVRHVLRTKDLLEKSYAFAPDRVTVNIIIKAILRWKAVFDPPKIKALFDQIIRHGYPVPPRWRRHYGVPFETPPSRSQSFTLPTLHSAISFERHVRPMYKLFIKAFYLRHDIRAAKMVIGILKGEELLVKEKREARDEMRRGGLAQKQLLARDVV